MSDARRVLVTGGAGFVGSAVVERVLAEPGVERVVVLDLLTYAGHLSNLETAAKDPRFAFVRGDICDGALAARLFAEHAFDAVLHLAAESHVDRSIDDAAPFVRTNVLGTQAMIEHARRAGARRFVHVSSDEVYGALGPTGRFTEDSPYAPSSPYAASKAASDMLVRAYVKTHGFPAVITHGANTYGPRQHPEKLVPVATVHALRGESIPVYGDGKQRREWLYVDDHAEAIVLAMARGEPGGTYDFCGESERENLATVHDVADAVDAALGRAAGTSRALVAFVADRKGHDFRYALEGRRAREALGWAPRTAWSDGLSRTVRWYAERPSWPEPAENAKTSAVSPCP
jgi:dTDP-glucose 4,6-dehydratase